MRNLLPTLIILLLSLPTFGQSSEGTEKGTYKYVGRSKYEGEWKDGKRHGQGTYTWSDGEGKIEGEFKEGKVWNAKVYNKSGKVINTWKNGVKD